MTKLITAETLTSDRILQYPSISRLFAENRIDLYFGGNSPLKEAFQKQGLNLEDFLIRLNALAEIEVNK